MLAEIHDYLLEYSESSADKYVDQLAQYTEKLEKQPESCAHVEILMILKFKLTKIVPIQGISKTLLFYLSYSSTSQQAPKYQQPLK
ncbi:MAG: hypothetical protein DHS20C18_38980 [Saprospiraceae bacterium]|nr:MAG: hypothetical protein DHS20C18_38980 [Saprospiraceae bacterium]